MRSILTAAFVTVFFASTPAFAQSAPDLRNLAPVVSASLPAQPVSNLASAPMPEIAAAIPDSVAPQRALLLSMYAANAGLQGYDAYSTLKGLKLGAMEANPLMKVLTKSPAGFVMFKAGLSAFTISQAERMWRTNHRGKAIALIAINNALMSLVAVNNHSVLSKVR